MSQSPTTTAIALKTRLSWRTISTLGVLLLASAACALGFWFFLRYAHANVMIVPVREFSTAEYPEDPANRSLHFSQYSGRRLRLVRKDETHFDFVFEPTTPHTATVIVHDVDVSLMTPGEPAWTKDDPHLERIALTDRQWNRQQVRFDARSTRVEISGGDGFEVANVASAELAKNCLNAGLWEILLFVREKGEKALYYQGWFTFPMGHYKRLFERNTGVSYWKHWYKMEHWSDPAGEPLRLDTLRRVVREREVPAAHDPNEPLIVAGEQIRKRRTSDAKNVRTWRDFFDGRKVRFATFAPPGRYFVNKPWKNNYQSIARFEKAILREIVSPATSRPLHELELVFRDQASGARSRFLVSGFNIDALPRLPVEQYPDGLYMPMGIGVPPFFQGYDDLRKNPPDRSPYFSVFLDDDNRWINHHELAVDGPVLHRDANDPALLHVDLLSYERHSLIGHYVIATTLPKSPATASTE
ncbi:MAG: hypothetical protein NVSMB9_12210 [Isosphaeraceae bacterium]